MSPLELNLANRERLLAQLRAELVGPDPSGQPVPLAGNQELTWEQFRAGGKQLSGGEIIWNDPPTRRYGAGVLFPIGVDAAIHETGAEGPAVPEEGSEASNEAGGETPEGTEGGETTTETAAQDFEDPDEEGVTLANAFRPCAMGISFLANFGVEKVGIRVELVSVERVGTGKRKEAPCGTYRPLTLKVGKERERTVDRTVWLRTSVVDDEGGAVPYQVIPQAALLSAQTPIRMWIGPSDLRLQLVVVSRSWHGSPSQNHRLVTVSIINKRERGAGGVDGASLYQAGLRASGVSSSEWIDAYPDILSGEFRDEKPLADENVNRVLYRDNRMFAIGHGCSADWADGRPASVGSVWSDVVPNFETPTTSPDLFVKDAAGNWRPLRVGMRELAGLVEGDDGLTSVDELVSAYSSWIADLERSSAGIEAVSRPTAAALIAKCRECEARITGGISMLREPGSAGDRTRKAFRLANLAMLISQLRTRQSLREPVRVDGAPLTWNPEPAAIDPSLPDPNRGYWRPFQIAFLLMSLRGIVQPHHVDRDMVDLIWFPTGGGKTEAYLGLTAFTVFHNALSGRVTSGVDVLMRYTLRLLTAQQFQRAATLFCAMEHLRRRDVHSLGSRPFRIGLWVGGSASPNKRVEAIAALSALMRDADSENPFVLLRCPWCAARFGPVESEAEARGGAGAGRRARRGTVSVYGYVRERTQQADTVVFKCPDPRCEFGHIPGQDRPGLPIVVIDEDLLDSPPHLLIGTVDKFAMLAWNPQVRRIFGLDDEGKHAGPPPALIIQDELHLISGPLGTMVGAYETVIEALCADPVGGDFKPKIVASTATISRAQEQVHALYARRSVFQFPPAGLVATDSFFAREAVQENGDPKPGRLYVGVLAPAHSSLQTTEARVFASLMQNVATMDGEPEVLDPWWTLLVFFNSLRELGGAATLFSADAREYLRVILSRHGVGYERIRQLHNVEELTSRIRSDHIPKLLELLEVPLRVLERAGARQRTQTRPIDACLASNIIEVGVDILRLALMVVVGQPKTTSQYIQVTSRVGRDTAKPGLVVVLYGQTKPRDRSHYEKFRSYHQRLYAQVEPTSVTPFSPPAVDRALHALIVALTRQAGRLDSEAVRPDPFPLDQNAALKSLVEDVIGARVAEVAPLEVERVVGRIADRLQQWRAWNPGEYGGFGPAPDHPPLMHPAGSTEPPQWQGLSWPTMSSLRNVDANCEADITLRYNDEGASNP